MSKTKKVIKIIKILKKIYCKKYIECEGCPFCDWEITPHGTSYNECPVSLLEKDTDKLEK